MVWNYKICYGFKFKVEKLIKAIYDILERERGDLFVRL